MITEIHFIDGSQTTVKVNFVGPTYIQYVHNDMLVTIPWYQIMMLKNSRVEKND